MAISIALRMPRDSWRASKAFRKHIAVEMAKRALIESVKRCGGEI